MTNDDPTRERRQAVVSKTDLYALRQHVEEALQRVAADIRKEHVTIGEKIDAVKDMIANHAARILVMEDRMTNRGTEDDQAVITRGGAKILGVLVAALVGIMTLYLMFAGKQP